MDDRADRKSKASQSSRISPCLPTVPRWASEPEYHIHKKPTTYFLLSTSSDRILLRLRHRHWLRPPLDELAAKPRQAHGKNCTQGRKVQGDEVWQTDLLSCEQGQEVAGAAPTQASFHGRIRLGHAGAESQLAPKHRRQRARLPDLAKSCQLLPGARQARGLLFETVFCLHQGDMLQFCEGEVHMLARAVQAKGVAERTGHIDIWIIIAAFRIMTVASLPPTSSGRSDDDHDKLCKRLNASLQISLYAWLTQHSQDSANSAHLTLNAAGIRVSSGLLCSESCRRHIGLWLCCSGDAHG